MHVRQTQAGRQRQGCLWSTLGEVCGLLRIPAAPAGADDMLFQHVQFKTGQRVLRIGQACDALYIPNSGFLKTLQIDEFGNERVLGFPMKGDLLGADGIHSGFHVSEAVALSDCDLIVLPFAKLASLSRLHQDLDNILYRMMSCELVKRQVVIGMLGAMSAEARVARFLLSLSERFVEMGYSSKLFNLRMTRQEIGSYLGLTLETVSRTLSAFSELGLITVHQRAVAINDPEALRTLRGLPPSRARAAAAKRRAWLDDSGDAQALRRSSTGLSPKSGASR